MLLEAIAFLVLFLAYVLEKAQHYLDAREWARERAQLLTRIQAPELGVLPETEPVAYVAPDDDRGYWDAAEMREEA